ncbi:hypothetical protein ACFV06_40755, partial [Streptomyces sp. NPDC059618]|uniref:hypothetical protein n=1 Tax=Streptomyces sp. NPDC059618 TaxID=3346887 RepID=UPI0036B635A7
RSSYSSSLGLRALGWKMEPVMLALATALVSAMVTDGWQHARSAAVDVWRRSRPEGEAEAVGLQLTDTRTRVLAARECQDAEAERTVVTDWAALLQRVASRNPDLVNELGGLLLPESGAAGAGSEAPTVMKARATGRARVYQAGRDIILGEQ